MSETTTGTYELTLLITPEISEFDAQKVTGKIIQSINDKGGTIIKESFWGKKRLAYPIKKFEFGYYHTLIFTLPTEEVTVLTHELELSHEVLRYLNISVEKEGVTIDQLFTPEKEELAATTNVVKERYTTKDKEVVSETPVITMEEESNTKTKEPTISEADRKQKLDEQLDKILSDEE